MTRKLWYYEYPNVLGRRCAAISDEPPITKTAEGRKINITRLEEVPSKMHGWNLKELEIFYNAPMFRHLLPHDEEK